MTNRKAGWYWVQVFEGGQWGCFNWNGHAWRDRAGEYPEEIFDVVGPRIPTPDEPWQCVPVEPTEKMRRRALSCNDFESGGTSVDDFNSDIYLAMLSAAPNPEDV